MKSPFLLSLQEEIRKKHYSIKTEETYRQWVTQFIRFHQLRHPSEMGEVEVREFLDHLALKENVAPRTQKTALNSIVFMYRHVVGREPGDFSDYQKANGPEKLPVVLTREELRRLFRNISENAYLSAALMYGSGLRVIETVRLRYSDIELDRLTVRVRDGKENATRTPNLAQSEEYNQLPLLRSRAIL